MGLNETDIVGYSEVSRDDALKEWNNLPEVKSKKVRAIDETREKPVSKKIYYAGVVCGILFLFLIGLTVVIVGYTVYNDGTLKDSVQMICPEFRINEGAIKCEADLPTNCVCEPSFICEKTDVSNLNIKIDRIDKRLEVCNVSA